MPTAIPAGATAKLVPARMIDPRGHRFGAGLSVVILLGGLALDQPIVVPIVLAILGTSAAFGMRYSLFGAIWRRLVITLGVPRAKELEHEYPPRFAQTLGSVALALSTAAFVVGLPVLGWAFALAVAGLQGLLAVTGYCLGCRLYFLRWWVPDLVTRIWSRETVGGATGARIHYR